MIKEDYPVTLHENRSIYGVELDIGVPDNDTMVIMAQDVFGEEKECMQLLIYPATDPEGDLENGVSIRIGEDGSIYEVVVPKDIRVQNWDTAKASPWLIERHGT